MAKSKKTTKPDPTVQEILLERVMASGKTVTELAEATGISQATMSKWTSRVRKNISGPSIDKLARHFGLTLTAPTR